MLWKLKPKHKKLLKKAGVGIFKGSKTAFHKMANIGEALALEEKKRKKKRKGRKQGYDDNLNELIGGLY